MTIWQTLAIVAAVMVAGYLFISILFALALCAVFGSFTGGKGD